MRPAALVGAPNSPLYSLLARRWRPKWVCQFRRTQTTGCRGYAAMTSADKPYYVTTPIFYVNAAPHVGHFYTMVLADVLKRWQVLKGRKTVLCTGIDEHGMKVQQAAAKAGIEPKPFCDKGAAVFQDLAHRANLSNDHFVRTTDTAHKEAVEYAWHVLVQHDYIYESKHEGWYCVSDETFYPASAVQPMLDPATGKKIMVSTETGKEVQWTSEVNYHFRLSAFRDRLLAFYEESPEWITPPSRMAEIVESVKAGLEDLSVSRPYDRLSWGIRTPTDSSQTIYVWLDALLNYASKVGYPWTPGREGEGGWPPDVQVIGKDIIRFHCIYWPAFLMALGVTLPKRIMTHAHWTLGRKKMAKSTGTGVNPFFAMERFGTDVMRYYLIHNGGLVDDADYENSFIIQRYIKDLKNGLGNLTSRVMLSDMWNVRSAVERFTQDSLEAACSERDAALEDGLASEESSNSVWRFMDDLMELPVAVKDLMEDLQPNRALQTLMGHIWATNAFFQTQRPWELAKALRKGTDPSGTTRESKQRQLDCIIYMTAETLRITGILLQPVMPDKARLLLDMLGVGQERRQLSDAVVGADQAYGVSNVASRDMNTLFPPLASDT